MAPGSPAGDVGRTRGQIASDAFTFQEDGKLRCPAGASLNFGRGASRECLHESELSTWPTRPTASPVLCENSVWRKAAKGNRARRVSAVRRLLPPPSSVERQPVLLGSMRWVDVAGRALRRSWTTHWRQQYVQVLPLAQIQQEAPPPARPPRALRSHHCWSWHDRLTGNAGFGLPRLRVTVAGVPSFLAVS
jgi:hypothetical protein